jgi:hypothetical protein
VRFQLDQALPGSVQEVLAAFTDPAFVTSAGDLGKVGAPEMLDQQRDGDIVRQRVRYRFAGDLSPAVTSVIDRDKLVFVDEHTYDLTAATASFRILPEHYGERLRCGGTERFHPLSDGANRRVEAELTVKWPIVGGLVERAIVSGLKEHLAEEAELIARWLTRER